MQVVRQKIAIGLVLALAFGACATKNGVSILDIAGQYNAATLDDMRGKIETGRDEVEDYRWANSKRVTIGDYGLPMDVYVWATQRGDRTSVTIYAELDTLQHVLPVTAFVGKGVEANVRRIDADVNCGLKTCRYLEKVALTISAPDLALLIADDSEERIPVRVIGKSAVRVDAWLRKTEIIATLDELNPL